FGLSFAACYIASFSSKFVHQRHQLHDEDFASAKSPDSCMVQYISIFCIYL
ncbi:UNVERIFIED_CONTAM: hypothetical protein K2H54_037626, partial [Gekko kuhli]